LATDRIKDLPAVLGKLSAMLGISTPLSFEVDDAPAADVDVSPAHRRTAALSASRSATPMDVSDGGRDEGTSLQPTDYRCESRTGPTVLLCEHPLFISEQKSPKVGSLEFMDSSELQNCNLKFLLSCKPKWHNKANR
jgi:hypothetical protein